jgi:hypothetical protein
MVNANLRDAILERGELAKVARREPYAPRP